MSLRDMHSIHWEFRYSCDCPAWDESLSAMNCFPCRRRCFDTESTILIADISVPWDYSTTEGVQLR